MSGSQGGSGSGSILTKPCDDDVDEIAVRIGNMWIDYNTARNQALQTGEEARQYIFATDIDQTSAKLLPHKNRTHQPKLTQISDTLQCQYYEASLSMPDFFMYKGAAKQDQDKAHKIESWVRQKLEQRKFREGVGRQLIADFVIYGNAFASVDYVHEKDDNGTTTYVGPDIKRISPVDFVFNHRAETFQKAAKLERKLIHVAELSELVDAYPNSGFDEAEIKKAIEFRQASYVDDWVQVIKERGLQIDGFANFATYFKQDMVEVLIYRGDIFDPDTGEADRHRVVYVVDRTFVIRNERSKAPVGYDGLHSAGWRLRNDNLWAQGPLDNLVGMQYRLNHLENLKADVFDLIAHPVIVITGDEVEEPENGYAPGAVYRVGAEGKVEMLKPDATVLQADTQIAEYHKMMEDFTGALPQARGVRTPGEKTAFEVNSLGDGAASFFIDKARNFERLIETLLNEVFQLMLVHYDGTDYVELTNDITGEVSLKQLSQSEVNARGAFSATGARHWERRTREMTDLQNFQMGPMQDPKIRQHVSGEKMANLYERLLKLEDEDIVEPFAGIKEDVAAKAISQAEMQGLAKEAGIPGDAAPEGSPSEVQPGPGTATPSAPAV